MARRAQASAPRGSCREFSYAGMAIMSERISVFRTFAESWEPWGEWVGVSQKQLTLRCDRPACLTAVLEIHPEHLSRWSVCVGSKRGIICLYLGMYM